jgi:hypothetical protein
MYENEDNYFIIRELASVTLRIKINNSNLYFNIREVKNIIFQLLKKVSIYNNN